jgi:3-methyladenine DNA glycosylase AlkD
VGTEPSQQVNGFLDTIAAEKTEGGWVVIGSALAQQLERDLAGALARCRPFAIAADIWYGADILGERVPGPALLSHFEDTLPLLSPWRHDANRWVRRMVGVAAHFWAKRTRGVEGHVARALELLAFLEPMFEEREMDAAKGVGWGLKTIGRHYPDLMVEWLPRQLHRPHRALMRRKAITYLSDEQRAQVSGGTAEHS